MTALDAVVLADIEFVVGGDQAVVLKGLVARGLGVGAGKGDVADLEALGGGEEGHVGGVVEERVAEAALVDEDDAEAGFLGFDRAGEAGGSGADDEKVEGAGRRAGRGFRGGGVHDSRLGHGEGLGVGRSDGRMVEMIGE